MSIKLSGQRGIYIPILAFVFLAILAILIGLGIDSSNLKHASADLRLKLEEICKNTSYNPMLQGKAIRIFADQINQLVNSPNRRLAQSVQVYHAKLIIPTFCIGDPWCTQVTDDVNFSAIPNPDTGAVSGFARCNLDGGSDCVFSGKVNKSDYPPTLWEDFDNAGYLIACEIRARAQSMLPESLGGGTEEILAKTVWARPVRGNYLRSVPASTPKGLTIAIASEMTTDVNDPRFRFFALSPNPDLLSWSYQSLPLGPNWSVVSDFMDRYDPLFQFSPTNSGGRLGFSADPVAPLGNITYALAQPSSPSSNLHSEPGSTQNRDTCPAGSVSPEDTIYGQRFGCLPGINCTTNPGSNCLVLSDREEMLAACMNPAVLVRNLFLTTILELAARHGEMRYNTEILHVNPTHRNVAENLIPSNVNPPALISKFGQDIVTRQFQIPYVTYDSGMTPIDSSAPPGKNGWINPFTSNADVNWRSHHALIAAQLRYCYHLYQGSPSALNGTYAGLNRYIEGIDYNATNFLFEPEMYQLWKGDRSGVFPLAHDYPSSGGGQWEQNHAWDSGETPIGSGSVNRYLSAVELVSILGATQSCPYNQNVNSSACYKGRVGDELSLNWAESNPQSATLDLRPDILGTLRYVNQSAAAIAAPGLFPLVEYPLAGDGRPFDPPGTPTNVENAAYKMTAHANSHVLIVTHQRLSPNDVERIYQEVGHGSLATRPITIAYFPTTKVDASNLAIDRMRCAFHVAGVLSESSCPDGMANTNTPDPNDPNQNALFVFSPYLPKYNADGNPMIDPNFQSIEDQSKPEQAKAADHFQLYWIFLQTDGRQNIVKAAENIFLKRILKEELKF